MTAVPCRVSVGVAVPGCQWIPPPPVLPWDWLPEMMLSNHVIEPLNKTAMPPPSALVSLLVTSAVDQRQRGGLSEDAGAPVGERRPRALAVADRDGVDR